MTPPLAGRIDVVVAIDPEPAITAGKDVADQLAISFAATARERAAARERLLRRHVGTTALLFDGLGDRRHRLNPRRLFARWHAHACRDLIDLSTAAATERPDSEVSR
jgi:hypothetical protein